MFRCSSGYFVIRFSGAPSGLAARCFMALRCLCKPPRFCFFLFPASFMLASLCIALSAALFLSLRCFDPILLHSCLSFFFRLFRAPFGPHLLLRFHLPSGLRFWRRSGFCAPGAFRLSLSVFWLISKIIIGRDPYVFSAFAYNLAPLRSSHTSRLPASRFLSSLSQLPPLPPPPITIPCPLTIIHYPSSLFGSSRAYAFFVLSNLSSLRGCSAHREFYSLASCEHIWGFTAPAYAIRVLSVLHLPVISVRVFFCLLLFLMVLCASNLMLHSLPCLFAFVYFVLRSVVLLLLWSGSHVRRRAFTLLCFSILYHV